MLRYYASKVIFLSIVLIGVGGLSNSLEAQSLSTPTRNSIFTYKSPVQQRIEHIATKTTPDYYRDLYLRTAHTPTRVSTRSARIQQSCEETFLCPTSPLPVRLVDFDGKRVDHYFVSLHWTTTYELANHGFEVERSFDGQDFVNIGFVKGRGHENQTSTYTFLDREAGLQRSYFRLKQLDLNGKFTYSSVITIEAVSNSISIVTAPNPGKQKESYLRFTGVQTPDQTLGLALYNVNGQLIYNAENVRLKSDGLLPLKQFPDLALGLYIVKVNIDGQILTTRFVISD